MEGGSADAAPAYENEDAHDTHPCYCALGAVVLLRGSGMGSERQAGVPRREGQSDCAERLAARDDERFQQPAGDTLACLGPHGVLRLAGLVATRPQLLCFLVRALDSSDDVCAAAASALLQLQFVPDQKTALTLRERMQRRRDKKTISLVMLLTADQPASDQEWLKVMDLEPAVLRQRAVQTLGRSASGNTAPSEETTARRFPSSRSSRKKTSDLAWLTAAPRIRVRARRRRSGSVRR